MSGVAIKHGVMPKPFFGVPSIFPPQIIIHFLLKNMQFLEKESWGFSNWRLEENVFNLAKLFGGAI
jgi:hypothetical protein